jgi:TPR repeat protein
MDLERAAILYRMAAEGGLPEAAYQYAKAFRTGRGVRRNLRKAADWFTAAAVLGHIEAQLAAAEIYDQGQGIPRDPARAYFWYGAAEAAGVFGADADRARVARELSAEKRAEVDERLAVWLRRLDIQL